MVVMQGADDMFAPIQRVIARRLARIVFGGVLLLGTAVLLAPVRITSFGESRRAMFSSYAILDASWLAAFALAGLGFAITRKIRWARDPDFLLAPSICVPMLGLALLLPITIHMFVFWATGSSARSFYEWIEISVVVAGPAHIALAIGVIVRSRALVAGRPAPSPGVIYVITIAVSCVPFIVLLLPPLIVAATGVPFLFLLQRMEIVVERERSELADAAYAPPRAVVI